MSDRQWFCMYCMRHHDIVGGVIQCGMPRPARSLTGEEMRQAVRWAMEHPIKVSGDDA